MHEQPFNQTGYNEHLKARKLMASRCKDCGKAFLPPRETCPECGKTNMEWMDLLGTGSLSAFTHVYVGQPELQQEGVRHDRPYTSGIVRLQEGISVSAPILGDPADDHQHFRIGMPVQAVFIERGPEGAKQVFLAFETT